VWRRFAQGDRVVRESWRLEGFYPRINSDRQTNEIARRAKTCQRIAEIGGSKTIETQRSGGSGGMTRNIRATETLLHPAILAAG
jgi:hypothetical protein